MASDPRLTILLDALRGAEAFLRGEEKTEIRVEFSLATEIAALALVRAAHLVRSIVLLLENGEAFGAESVIRTLVELGLNAGWVDRDEKRAVRYRDYGLGRAEQWLKEIRQYGFVFSKDSEDWLKEFLSKKSGTPPQFPSAFERAEEVEIEGTHVRVNGMRRTYTAFRRLSGGVHADYWHLAAFATPEANASALMLDGQDAVAATRFVISVASEVVGWADVAAPVVEALRAAAETSFNRPTGT